MIRLYTHWLDDPDGLFWMVDEGPDSKGTAVKAVRISSGCGARAAVDPTILQQDARDKDAPKAWIEVDGELTIRDDVAVISRSRATGDASTSRDVEALVAAAVEEYAGLDAASVKQIVTERLNMAARAKLTKIVDGMLTAPVKEKVQAATAVAIKEKRVADAIDAAAKVTAAVPAAGGGVR